MATYGSRDKNPFEIPKTYDLNGKQVPSNNGNAKYYLLVDSVTGDITIKTKEGKPPSSAGGNTDLDRTVGTIPKDGVFKPVVGETTSPETQYFTSAQGQKNVKNHAVITAQNAGLDPQKAQQLIFPNTALPAGGGTPTTIPQLPFSPGRAAETKIVKLDIRYPIGLGTDHDRISFQAHQINPRAPGVIGQVTNFTVSPRGYTPADGIVYLGIQAPINDQNTVAWQSGEINSIDAFLLNSSLNLMKSPDAAQAGADMMQQAFDQAGPSAPQIQLYIASQAAGVSNVLSRYGNQVLNPNLELLFQGPQLRPFTFQFKMSARSQPEADAIKTIIKYFKFNMAVKIEPSGVFLNSPRVFKIQYQYKTDGNVHLGLNLIKECALTACSVDYTPLGSYATFGDGTMVRYDMNLQFQELAPVYDVNYLETVPPDHPIGY